MNKTKPFEISKWAVWHAYQRIKANKGGAGVDQQTMEDFEADLKNNLYKLWNRMSSGSYFPPPVRLVEIPKTSGGHRPLGIPTVSDRIAQMVVKMKLEPVLEPHFHRDSYGYRPRKSAIEAVRIARRRCWRYNWAVDLDIEGFFDTLDHELVMRAVKRYTDCPWVILYIQRWLQAPVQHSDGTQATRDQGTPQGSVISPLLANLFLHLAFDSWMQAEFPTIPFERYADDMLVHCTSEAQARVVLQRIQQRLKRCRLKLHPQKTKIVYCKDDNRRGKGKHESFDFLGFTFRPRCAKNRQGKFFIGFLPAVSSKAAQRMRQHIRSWHIARRSDRSLEQLVKLVHATFRGWINYYGQFYPSELRKVFRPFDRAVCRWAMRKFKRLRERPRRAEYWLGGVAQRQPNLFVHWKRLGNRPSAG